MSQYQPNFLIEALLAALRFSALFTVFYKLHMCRRHTPATRARRIALIIGMALQYPFCRIVFFAAGRSFAVSAAADTVIFSLYALLCGGYLLMSVISAIYFNGMLQFIVYIMASYLYAFTGKQVQSFSFWSYLLMIIEHALLLVWAFFYYRTARNVRAAKPLRFWLITVLTPLLGIAVLAATADAGMPLLQQGVNIFLYGGLFGTLLLILNICVFYLYVKLSVAYEARVFAEKVANTPPVYTQEKGLSPAFIEKYEITARERQVIELVLRGKSNKEIARELNIAVNTTEVHLKHIYQKTAAPGRYALAALIQAKIGNL